MCHSTFTLFLQDRLREAHAEAAAERDAAAARGEEVHRCKAYIETVEAKLRVHGEYIAQLETSLSDAQVRALTPEHLTMWSCRSGAVAPLAAPFDSACILASWEAD